ncbi:hypothetical protein ACROYT_G037379 [Oculina patagonica]
MSGLTKPKEYDWKDSNVALLGSDQDKKVKKAAAKTEPAWRGCEDLEGTRIWRIEKFEVKPWPKKKYGTFYNGDSYIVLHGEKDPESEKLLFDVHFWIGKQSTQDEYGTAAYKTVELDTYLDDAAVQHREVEGSESEEFLEYFGNNIEIDDGGVESGFNHVDPEANFAFKDMVKHFKKVNVNGKEVYEVVDVSYNKNNFHCDDGYAVIFSGDRMIQVKGSKAKMDAICPLNQWISEQKELYPKATLEVYDSKEEFKKDKVSQEAPSEFVMKLIRVLTDKGKPEFKEIASGVFLLETHNRCIVWVGAQASSIEKQNAFSYATQYLQKQGQNPICGITVMRENNGKTPKAFANAVGQRKGVSGAQDHHM